MAEYVRPVGGLTIFVLAFLAVNLLVRPFTPQEHDWADFLFRMCFFILGFVPYSDDRLTHAVRRDWWILLTLGTVCLAAMLGMYLTDLPVFDWAEDRSSPWYYVLHSPTTIVALSYSLVILFIGMRFLNSSNRLLTYAQEAVLPFFMLHQPAIVIVASFVVPWEAALPIKLVAVVLGSFLPAMGLYEGAIRRVRPVRGLFGMRA